MIFRGLVALGGALGSPRGALELLGGALGVPWGGPWGTRGPLGGLCGRPWAGIGVLLLRILRVKNVPQQKSEKKQRLQGTQPSFRVGVGRPRLTFSRVLRDKNVIAKITKQKQQETQPSCLVPLGRPRSTLARILRVKNVVQ